MWDLLKVTAAVGVLVLGVRAATAGAPERSAGKVFPYPVHETALENGLKVVVVPFDSPGLIAYWTVVRAGSRNEIEPGKSGFAHFFEHMMFRGTDRFPTKKYNDTLRELGAEHNAFTTDDYTAYHILAPAAALDTVMTLEADRFMHLKYTEEAFKKEAGAVLGEYNKNASTPFQTLFEKQRDTAFTVHTYKHTTIGFLRDIEDMPDQYDYSRQFFDRFYRPETCILLMVGDVKPKQAVALARRHYGAWKRGSYRFEVPAEPAQTEERRVEAAWPSPTEPYLFIGYHGPAFSVTARDLPALDVMSQLVFSEAGPLYQKLVVEEQEVDIFDGSAADHRDPYLFAILARVKNPGRVAYVEQAITTALDRLKEEAVAPERLEAVKAHLKYGFAMGLNTAQSAARNLAHYLALTGDPGAVNALYAQYDRITADDIRTVAAKYFVPANRTVVVLRHAAAAPEAEAAPAGEGEGR